MKLKTRLVRTLALIAITVLSGLASARFASADPSLIVQIGSQGPPPQREDHQWQRPYHSAVWIPGHNEWSQDGGYVWVAGYYTYPPRGKSQWVSPRYAHHQNGYSYNPGHWSN